MLTYKINPGGHTVMQLVKLVRATVPASIPDMYPTQVTVKVAPEHAQLLVDALNENGYQFYLDPKCIDGEANYA